jgi:integrase
MTKEKLIEYKTRRGDTRFRARVRLKGVSLSKTFKTKTHANQWLQKEERRIRAEVEVGILDVSAGSKVTVHEAVESYKLNQLPRLTSRDTAIYGIDEVDRILGSYRLNEVDSDIIFQAVQEYRKGGKRGRGETSANKFIQAISNIYREARRKRWTNAAPTKGLPRYSEDKYQRTRTLSPEEQERLFVRATENKNPIMHTAIWLALLAGYRKDWIRHLKWEYINWDKRFIQLPIAKVNPRGERGKNKAKSIPLVEHLYEALKKHRELLLAAGVDSPYVFPQPKNSQRACDFTKAYKTSIRQAGIQNMRFHDLRHTIATNLIMEGVHVRVVQDVLGHKDPRSTQRYTHVPTEHMRSELERAFSNNKGEDANENQ